MLAGQELTDYFSLYQRYGLSALIAILLLLWLCIKIALPCCTFKGRRLLLGRWRRISRWEFWPLQLFYIPVVLYILYLGIKHRSLTRFTAANPAMPDGGFAGESKTQILNGLAASPEYLATYHPIPGDLSLKQRTALVTQFAGTLASSFPLVIKPDVGERGAGVSIARNAADIAAYLEQNPVDLIAQEYVAGAEFGVFYIRHPSQSKGHIFSITEKRFPTVTGNGKHSLEELILQDDRAVCMAPLHLARHAARLDQVPATGAEVAIVELGTHSRGAVFLDGYWVHTPALETAIDRISQAYEGFFFGRYDIRVPLLEDFKAGKNFKIVELNGVTSEATHIYDPQNTLLNAYRTLATQWRHAFEIGAANAQTGASPTPWRALLKTAF
jgi:hypothetical protein